MISEPRRRTQIKRYGHDESQVDMSELDSSSDSDDELGRGSRGKLSHSPSQGPVSHSHCCIGRKNKTKFGRIRPKSMRYGDDYIPEGEVTYGSWARSECFKVEKGLLTFG